MIVATEIESVHGATTGRHMVFYRCQDHQGKWYPYGPVHAGPEFDREAFKAVAAAKVAESLAAAEFEGLTRGYGKRATLKRKREAEFDAQVRDIYRALLGDPRTADEAEAIVASVTQPVRVKGESEAAREAALMARAESLRKRADAMDAAAVQAEIALRLLYDNLLDEREREDAEDLELLLSHIL